MDNKTLTVSIGYDYLEQQIKHENAVVVRYEHFSDRGTPLIDEYAIMDEIELKHAFNIFSDRPSEYILLSVLFVPKDTIPQ